MSKYLRTKDNLYEVESSFVDYRGTRIYQTVENVLIEETKVVTTGDNVEEVCDEFVCKRPSGETYILDRPFNLKAQQKYIGEIYGAIWTDKGLIYKAKLNKESGVLELYGNN